MTKKLFLFFLSLFFIILFSGCAKNGISSDALVHGKYVGNFVDNKRHGYGVFTWKSGKIYKGMWDRNYRKQGIMTWPKNDKFGRVSYDGKWVNNKQMGEGVFVNSKGIVFKGYWFTRWLRGKLDNRSDIKAILKDKIVRGKFRVNLNTEIKPPIKATVTFLKSFEVNYGNNLTRTIPANSKYVGRVNKDYNPMGYGELFTSDKKWVLKGHWFMPMDNKKSKRKNVYGLSTKQLKSIPSSKKHKLKLYITKAYDQKIKQKKRDKQFKEQKCKTFDDWIYLGNQCSKNGYANGYGKAMSKNGKKTFEGTFNNGFFKEGTYIEGTHKYIATYDSKLSENKNASKSIGKYYSEYLDGNVIIYENNALVFDGKFSKGKKHGVAKCVHRYEGPELCEFRRGKRIDSTFISREENKKAKIRLKKKRQRAEKRFKKEQKRIKRERRDLYSTPKTSILGAIAGSVDKISQNLINAQKVSHAQTLRLTNKQNRQDSKKRYERKKEKLEQQRKKLQRDHERGLRLNEKKRKDFAYKKKQKKVLPETIRKEALAYCYKSSKNYWFCDGRIQKTQAGEKDVQKQLDYVGCENPRKSVPFKKGKLYFCDYKLKSGDSGKGTYNRDIRGWYNIPSNY